MSIQVSKPSVAPLKDSSYGSNLENYTKPRNKKKTMVPLLPDEHSQAERDARRKNTVLSRRLQSCLKDIARDRQTWLLRVQVETCRFRRQANALYNRLYDLSNNNDNNNNNASTASAGNRGGPDSSSPRNGLGADPRWARRPVTCLGSRKPGHHGRARLSAAAAVPGDRLRPKTSVSWNTSLGQIHGPPLFKVRGNRVRNTSSSSGDDVDDDSDECCSASSSSSSSFGESSAKFESALQRVKYGNSSLQPLNPSKKRKSAVSPKPAPGNAGARKSTQRCPSSTRVSSVGDFLKSASSPRMTSSTPRPGGGRGSQPFSPRSPRPQQGQGRGQGQRQGFPGLRSTSAAANARGQLKDGAARSSSEELAKRARARTALAGSRNYPGVGAVSGGGAGGGAAAAAKIPSAEAAGSFRDADYLRLVIDLERDKYEISQMKVKTYLQNLKI